MNFAQFIPQIFYDFIARITSGMALLITFFVIWPTEANCIVSNTLTQEEIDEGTIMSFEMILISLLIAYVLAYVLRGLWSITLGLISKNCVKGRVEKKAREYTLIDIKHIDNTIPNNYKFPDTTFLFDVVRLKNPIVGSRLVKLRAEIQFLRIMILGLMICWMGVIAEGIFRCSCEFNYAAFSVLSIVIVGLCSRFYKHWIRVVRSLYNHFLLLHLPNTELLILQENELEEKELSHEKDRNTNKKSWWKFWKKLCS